MPESKSHQFNYVKHPRAWILPLTCLQELFSWSFLCKQTQHQNYQSCSFNVLGLVSHQRSTKCNKCLDCVFLNALSFTSRDESQHGWILCSSNLICPLPDFTKSACQDSCLLEVFNICHYIKTHMTFIFQTDYSFILFWLVRKQKALRFSCIWYTSVKPVLLVALWAAACITQLGIVRVNRKTQRRIGICDRKGLWSHLVHLLPI